MVNLHTARTVKCDQCDRMYPTGSLLRSHIKESHLVEEVSCDICGKVYANSSKLQGIGVFVRTSIINI